MTKKKSPSQVLHSYKNLIARVRADETSLTSLPGFDSSIPDLQHDPEHINDASLDELDHLRDLIHLKDRLTMLKHRLPVMQSMVFTSSLQYIRRNPYKQTDYNLIEQINTGSSALSLTAHINQAFLTFELRVFEIFHDLKNLDRVSDHLASHRRFHDSVLQQASMVLRDLDLIKEVEWRRQRSELGASLDESVFQNGMASHIHC